MNVRRNSIDLHFNVGFKTQGRRKTIGKSIDVGENRRLRWTHAAAAELGCDYILSGTVFLSGNK